MLRRMRKTPMIGFLSFCMMVGGCASAARGLAAPDSDGEVIEATSLLGAPLRRPDLDDETARRFEANLAMARADFAARPKDESALIWVGRRQAYLGRYQAAIETFSRGLDRHPDSARLLRHRGHRLITVRRFEAAVGDLERAARLVEGTPDAVEPDGLPNARDLPRSTTQTNIFYHLGLARYLQGDLPSAARAWQRCLALSPNDDMRVASAYWLYLCHRRLGDEAEAATLLDDVHADMDVIENHAYHELLLLFKGQRRPDEIDAASDDTVQDATRAYGLSMYHLLRGDRARAEAGFHAIVSGPGWAAFGAIAAEAELAGDG